MSMSQRSCAAGHFHQTPQQRIGHTLRQKEKDSGCCIKQADLFQQCHHCGEENDKAADIEHGLKGGADSLCKGSGKGEVLQSGGGFAASVGDGQKPTLHKTDDQCGCDMTDPQ